jgi:hypothetical protein
MLTKINLMQQLKNMNKKFYTVANQLYSCQFNDYANPVR